MIMALANGRSEAAPGCGIVFEKTAAADAFAYLLERAVAGLVHNGAFGGAAFGGRGGEAGAQGVSRQGCCIEAGLRRLGA